jgi:hypothetical protein
VAVAVNRLLSGPYPRTTNPAVKVFVNAKAAETLSVLGLDFWPQAFININRSSIKIEGIVFMYESPFYVSEIHWR